MATDSSPLAWKISWTEEPGRLQSRTRLSDFTHFSLPHIGEGNGNPLQCSCLENPRDGGAWWAAIYGVAQSWTRLKRLSSGSSRLGKNSDSGGNGGISMVGLGANKGPGLTSRMPYIRAEGHWVTQGLGACGLAWLTMQTFNKEWNNREMVFLGFPAVLSGKESACQSRRHGFDP